MNYIGPKVLKSGLKQLSRGNINLSSVSDPDDTIPKGKTRKHLFEEIQCLQPHSVMMESLTDIQTLLESYKSNSFLRSNDWGECFTTLTGNKMTWFRGHWV